MKREYRSRFEERLGRKLKKCNYEPFIVPYEYKATYLPDFVPKNDPTVIIEAKGCFRNKQEIRKYIAVAESNPHLKLVFILMYPNKPMPGAKRRRDGTKYSMREWCENHEFDWYTEDTLPKEWT